MSASNGRAILARLLFVLGVGVLLPGIVALGFSACQVVPMPGPAPVPGPAPDPLPPPPDPSPPLPDPEQPPPDDGDLASLVLPGMSVAQVEQALGSQPIEVPAHAPMPWTVRWTVSIDSMLVVLFSPPPNPKALWSGMIPVEVAPGD